MATYPYGLPLAQISDFSGQSSTGRTSVVFERGNRRQRKISRKARQTFGLSFILTTVQLDNWQSWANSSGYDWQFLNLASPYSSGTITPHYIRFISAISLEMIGAGLIRASVQAELHVDSVHTYVITPSANWTIAYTPLNPAPNWIKAGTPASPSVNTLTAGPPRTSGSWYIGRTPATLPSDRILAGTPASPPTDTITAGYPALLAA
jgi:hypothetical protein